MVPEYLRRELPSSTYMLWKLSKRWITKDEVDTRRRRGELVLVQLVVLHFVS